MYEPASPPLPKSLGRYEVLCVLGQGGMATLYLARAPGIDGRPRLFAVKLIHEHLCREKPFVHMFLDEARLTTRILHANVVAAHEIGTEGGRHFIVMDYVNGETLAFAIMTLSRERKKIPIELAVFVALEIGRGLHAAHELSDELGQKLNVVHRDVAPQNVLLGYDGSVRLTDFGVAKAKDRASHTEPGMLKGRLAYMAPEHIKHGAEPDRRVDVFSLGAVLWESLAGRRLFRGANDLETTERLLRAPIPKPSSLRSEIPPALDAIVMHALEREPSARFGTALELVKALEGVVQGRGLTKDLAKFLRESFKERYQERQALQQEAVSGHPSRVSLSAVPIDSDEPDEQVTGENPTYSSSDRRKSELGRAAVADLGALGAEPNTESVLDPYIAARRGEGAQRKSEPPWVRRDAPSASQPPPPGRADKHEPVAPKPVWPAAQSERLAALPDTPMSLIGDLATIEELEGLEPLTVPTEELTPLVSVQKNPTTDEVMLVRPVADEDMSSSSGPKADPAIPGKLRAQGIHVVHGAPLKLEDLSPEGARPNQRQVPTSVIRTRDVVELLHTRQTPKIALEVVTETNRPSLEVLTDEDLAAIRRPSRVIWAGAIGAAVVVGIGVALFWPAPESVVIAPLAGAATDAGSEPRDAAPVIVAAQTFPDASETIDAEELAVVADAAVSRVEALALGSSPPDRAEEGAAPDPVDPPQRERRRPKEVAIDVDVSPKSATLMVDGEASDGEVRRRKGTTILVEASAPGYRSMSKRVVLERNQRLKIRLEQEAKPVKRRSKKRPDPAKAAEGDSLLLIEGGDL